MGKIKTDGLKEVANEVIGVEHNKIFNTIKYLTINPSQVISEFCGGEKHKYLSPVVYFLGVGAIKLYLASISGLNDFLLKGTAAKRWIAWLGSKFPSLAATKEETETFVSNNSTFISFFNSEYGRELISLPIILLLTWLFYKRFNKSFKENSWFALYTWGHASLLSIPLILIFYITNDVTLFAPLSILILVLYCAWASIEFYKLKLGKALTLRVLMFAAYTLSLSITLNIFSKVIRLFTD
jgi:hypothetical protein